MGFGDKLKGLKDQAQQAVAENKDKIQGAVQVVGEAANTKTHGKYATKISKVGEKVESSVDKFADGGADAPDQPAGAAAPVGDAPGEPAAAASVADAPGEPAAAAPAADAPGPAFDIDGDTPREDCSDAPIAKQPTSPVTPSSADAASAGFPDFE